MRDFFRDFFRYLRELIYHIVVFGGATVIASMAAAVWMSLIAWAGQDSLALIGIEPVVVASGLCWGIVLVALAMMLRDLEWSTKPRASAVVESVIMGSIGFSVLALDVWVISFILTTLWRA